ncbi:5-HT1B [Drosophila busckii]|uniref:5-HT1B n=1 Tax=Drosophila busckii TaxID=30019 RepID=A0A0M4ELS3_DROBS|nr:5-hydroxytryptamine receptor 2A isoform X1 [Drosophila busckii]ALC42580.1 5-HT1B [Drosophila busckii]
MPRQTNFNDALDYIYVANSLSDNAYLIADAQQEPNEEEEQQQQFGGGGDDNNNNHYYNDGVDSELLSANAHIGVGGSAANTTPSTAAGSSLATAALAAAAASASVAAAAARITAKAAQRALATGAAGSKAIELIDSSSSSSASNSNNYTNVAVGLGVMLLNDTLLLQSSNDTLELGGGGVDGFGEFANGSGQLLSGNVSGAVNVTSKVTEDDFTELLRMAVTSVLLGLMILVTIIGNVFVIAAIILERNLQNVANYLVASLAVADLFVACLVMPLGAVYEISQGWILGPELCDIWTSCDVLCCTASILHLVAIAVDRYWAVTNIDYIHSRTSNRVFMMIFCVWTAAVIVSLAPQFGWKDPDYLQRIEQQKCMVSQDVSYQVFATCCTFYVPLLVILALYWKIYQTARKRIHRRRPRPIDVTANNNQPTAAASTDTKLQRLRLRLGRFSAGKNKTGAGAALGLVEGNSTNTVNTVEDTEFSSSNVDSKSRAGIEAAAAASTSGSQIATVSHLVALANQQHASSNNKQPKQIAAAAAATTIAVNANGNGVECLAEEAEQQQQQQLTELEAQDGAITTATATTAAATNVATSKPHGNGGAAAAAAVEVLEDPQLQQQLEQMQQLQKTAKSVGDGGGGASTSNATTITSISALSPQTPTSPAIAAGPMTAKTSTLTSCNQAHPLCSSANASALPTPEPRTKQQQQQQPQQQQQQQQQLSSIANPMQKVNKRKETLEAKRERKAAKTLAIITGAFVVCWLPFFVMALTMPLCAACQISDSVASLFLWLGYFNSTLNPVIYTIFSPEFRQAFKRILFGGHRPVHYRSGKL